MILIKEQITLQDLVNLSEGKDLSKIKLYSGLSPKKIKKSTFK